MLARDTSCAERIAGESTIGEVGTDLSEVARIGRTAPLAIDSDFLLAGCLLGLQRRVNGDMARGLGRLTHVSAHSG